MPPTETPTPAFVALADALAAAVDKWKEADDIFGAINAISTDDVARLRRAAKVLKLTLAAYHAATGPGDAGPVTIYAASRVKHAALWQRCRAAGAPIISTWIDEAGEGETADMGELWGRILKEIRRCSRVVLYAEPDDFPHKGALVEVGMALALGKPVTVCLPGVELEPRSCRPVGSWMHHPLVSRNDNMAIAVGIPADAAPGGR